MAKTNRLHIERSPVAALPVELCAPEDKVAYLLWREGEHCFCDLQVRTGLSRDSLQQALRALLKQRKVKQVAFPPNAQVAFPPNAQVGDDNDAGLIRFSLA